MIEILQTERTIVDYITLEDAAFFVTLVNTPDWLRNIGDRNVSDIDDAHRYLENGFLQSYRENGFGYYLVRTAARTPIGICGFLKKPNLEHPDFGFALLPDYYGQGFAFESSFAVLNYGIKTFNFTDLDAVVASDNLRSIRLLEKLGFHRHSTAAADTQETSLLLYRWQLTA